MKRALAITLAIIALLPSLFAYRLSVSEVTAAPLLSHKLDTIKPVVSDWPQKESNWCGAAALQAYIDYAWRFHHNDGGHYYTQSGLWDIMRDFTSSHFFAKGARGIGAALPGEVGDDVDQVRKLNIAYDFGVDPSALAWMMEAYGHDYYHYAVYRNGLYHATRMLLWTVEQHQEPVVAAVQHGSHYVLVIGYEAERSAIDPDGPGDISKVRYADPMYGPSENDAYKWRKYDSLWPPDDTWKEFFTEYMAPGDPDPSTGWYVPPPDLWQGGRVTVERDHNFEDYSPDWSIDGDTWQIMDHHDVTYLPDIKANWAGWNSTIVVRNNGSSDASGSVIFYDSAGYGFGTSMRTARDNSLIPAGGTWELDASTAVNNFSGSAIVSASEDVLVVVETKNSSSGLVKAYTGISSPEAEAFLPALYHSSLTSEITVQNTEGTEANIGITYYDRAGQFSHTENHPIPANGTISLEPPSGMGNDGSAVITSDRRIAAVSTTTWNSSDRTAAYTALATSDTKLYAPSVYRFKSSSGQWALFSATILQNTAGTTANDVRLQYVNRDTGNVDLTFDDSIAAYRARGYNTRTGGDKDPSIFEQNLGDRWHGSVRVEHLPHPHPHQLAGVGTTIWGSKNAAGHYRLFSPDDGHSSVVLPLQYRHKSGSTWQSWSAVNVMNVGSQDTTVTIQYFDEGGNSKLPSPLTATLQPGQTVGANTRNGGDFDASAFTPLGDSFTGSVVVTASGGDQRIAAIANLVYPDMAAVYDGVGR